MSAAGPAGNAEPDPFKRAAVELVENATVVVLGTGSTAAFAIAALARRHRQGLRFLDIPTSEHTAAQGWCSEPGEQRRPDHSEDR
jgi:ribose 5-phosphate isomerase A